MLLWPLFLLTLSALHISPHLSDPVIVVVVTDVFSAIAAFVICHHLDRQIETVKAIQINKYGARAVKKIASITYCVDAFVIPYKSFLLQSLSTYTFPVIGSLSSRTDQRFEIEY